MARILIDALGADSPGARRHLEGFLPALRERAGEHRFRMVIRESAAAELGPLCRGPIESWPVADGISRRVLTRLAYDVLYLPWKVRRWGFDGVVTLANFGPIRVPVPHVVFQRNAMHFSREYLGRIRGARLLEWKLRAWLSVAEMRFATVTVTPTDAMAELIRETHPSLASGNFATLFHGIDLSRFSDRGAGDGAGAFVFLYPTKPEAYKGVEVLLGATGRLAAERDDFEVHLTAPADGWPAAVQREIDAARGQPWFQRVRFLGSRPAATMPEVYAAADAVIYPSLCESFGFPLLESMACGRPIVAGGLAVNRELCADAALYYEEHSAEACAEAMRTVLVDEERREQLRAAARSRIGERDWSWDAYADRFVEICERAIAVSLPAGG